MLSSAMYVYAFSLALIAPLLVLAVALVFGLKAGVKARGFQISVAALPVALAVNPVVQAAVLEQRDERVARELVQRVRSASLVGKPASAVQSTLGEPTSTREQTLEVFTLGGQMVSRSRPQVVWEYKPTPLYWSSRSVQVVFEDDVVKRVNTPKQ